MTEETEVYERIARLEALLEDHISDEEKLIRSMSEKLDRIELELSRYRGFVGGILLVASSVVAFLKYFWEDLAKILKG